MSIESVFSFEKFNHSHKAICVENGLFKKRFWLGIDELALLLIVKFRKRSRADAFSYTILMIYIFNFDRYEFTEVGIIPWTKFEGMIYLRVQGNWCLQA